MTPTVQALQQQLQQLRAQHAAGTLADAPYHKARKALERELIDLLVASPAETAAPAAPARSSLGLRAGLVVATLAVAGAGYWWTGSPSGMGQAPAGFGPAAAAPGGAPASAAPEMEQDQMAALTERLAERLKGKPDDLEGWVMLGRSYAALGRPAEALTAYGQAMKLKPDDAGILADYADALAVSNGRSLEGEPAKYIDRALKIDPDNLKALALAGTVAFNQGDFAKAVQHWERLVKVGPPEHPIVRQAAAGVVEARERGKLPPVLAAAAPAAAAASGPAITGTVILVPGLKAQAGADDTVFIYARAAEGSRMPLAILRTRVRDLPFSFKLDDSLSMSPATRLSTAGSVVVTARVSRSGQAAAQPGDLEGTSLPTAVGANGVKVVINTAVK